MSDSWQKLNDGKTYKVYRDVDGLFSWLFCRYTIAAPGGSVVALAATRRGARRAIEKHRRKLSPRYPDGPKWWDKPIVEEAPR